MESCMVNMHTCHGVSANSSCFQRSPQVVIGSLTTLLIILFSHLSEIWHVDPWLLPVYGEMMFLPLPDYGLNNAHWNIQKFRILSVATANSMFCKKKFGKVLREPFAFPHPEKFLVWQPRNGTPSYRPSVGTEPADINLHWQGAGLLTNYWLISARVSAFHAFIHLHFFMCSIAFPCVISYYYT